MSLTSRKLFSSCLQLPKIEKLAIRTLFSKTSLGLENYDRTREKVKFQFREMEDRFRSKMTDFVAPDSKNMVFTEDLKNMLYLAEGNDEDLQLLEKMMLKYKEQNSELRFGSFIFGPVIMRTYHTLNKPKEALKAFNNPALKGMFDQLGSYQILLDLLYENKMYNEMLTITDYVLNQQHHSTRYPRNVVVLTLAACYKINSPDSLKYMSKFWKDLIDAGHLPMRRAITFAAGLAINQGSPHIALELLTETARQNYVTIRSLKVSALTDLNRLDDVLPILRSVLGFDTNSNLKQTFNKDVIEKYKLAVKKLNKKDITLEFERIYEQLTNQGHIVNTSLDELLCSEIEAIDRNLQLRDQRMVAASFNYNRDARNRRFPTRPGLQDIL
uniref:Pentacotripeptide-repeat region of PRORP domain-containing protein n=1 Tax=Clastoptera arizonana TaxID=38151 RepID=A0A1B6DXB7_9HEMI